MIVFVSMRSSDSSAYVERRDAISHDWCRLFDSFALTPVLIPNALDRPDRYFDEIPGIGLLLTGGDDLGGRERDHTEHRLLAAAVGRGMPIFGVCRGLQVINRYFGGTLTRIDAVDHVANNHEIEIIDTLEGDLALGGAVVNSFHNNAVLMDGLAKELCPFAMALCSDAGVVEGLYHPQHAIMAIQWHPERENPGSSLDKKLLHRWLKQCD